MNIITVLFGDLIITGIHLIGLSVGADKGIPNIVFQIFLGSIILVGLMPQQLPN